jgi:transposase-like protein
MSVAEVASIEVSDKAKRRRFTAEYKRRIVKESEACKTPGMIGELLRREGLYSSHLTMWRAARDRGELAPGAPPKKRGPKPVARDPRDQKIADQARAIARLTARAERAEAIVDIQKKLSQLLGINLPPTEDL